MKFNTITKRVKTLRNYEGEKAYTLSKELELYSTVVASSLSNTFYEKNTDRIVRLRKLIQESDPHFVAQLAVYAREKMYLRSVPLVLTVELAKVHNGDNLISRLVERVIQRADEITELLAYYQLANERKDLKKLNKLSKQLQKGLALAFNKFDEYQFAKYNRQTEVKLKDALFLVHPKAKSETQQQLFTKIVEDTLQVPYTWEVELSSAGQQKHESASAKKLAFKEKWEELIESKKLGYMALLRNLRNILQAEVSLEHVEAVTQRLADPYQVARSRQLPFRFLSAYRELKEVKSVHTTKLLTALEEAVQASVENLKGFDEKTKVLIACDVSGSMYYPLSPKSKVQLFDIGLVLGMLLQSKSKTVMSGIFGDTWKVINLPQKGILQNTEELRRREGEVGYSTNGYLVIEDLIRRKQTMDKVMIFTDMQLWNSNHDGKSISKQWQKYKKMAPKAQLYLFDLGGYGQVPLPLDVKGNGVYLIGGWSDKIFEVLESLENGQASLSEVKEIQI